MNIFSDSGYLALDDLENDQLVMERASSTLQLSKATLSQLPV